MTKVKKDERQKRELKASQERAVKYSRGGVSEPDSEEVHLLAVEIGIATAGAAPVPGVGSGLDTASVEAALAARRLALEPVLGHRGLADEAERKWLRGQQRQRPVLEAVGHVLVKLVQGPVGDATVVMIRPLALLK